MAFSQAQFCGSKLKWIWVLMIGHCLADLTCYESDGSYNLSDEDKCRVSDFNNAFNNGENLMTECGPNPAPPTGGSPYGWVSKHLLCLDVTCALLPV